MAKTKLFRDLQRAFSQAHAQAETKQSRRQFLKKAGAFSLGFSPLGQAFATTFSQARLATGALKPVIILGGGAAGLAAAYTLKKARVPYQLIEANSRLGGRIFTMNNLNHDHQFTERGAELVDSNHKALRGLAQELNVEIETFDDRRVESEIYFIGGQVYTNEQLVNGIEPLVNIIIAASEEINVNTPDVVTYKNALNSAAIKYDHMTIREFLDKQTSRVDAWILKVIASAYVGEFGRELDEQPAYSLIGVLAETNLENGFSMFGSSDECARVKGGNSRLIEALYQALGGDANTSLTTGTPLTSMKKVGSQIVCGFKGAPDQAADHVICAIPFSTLRECDLTGLSLSDRKKKCIETLGYGTGSKISLSFKDRFWRNKTELAPANSGLVYGDFASQEFWDSSRKQKGGRGVLTNFLGGYAGLNCDENTIATALNDLATLYPRSSLTELYDGRSIKTNWNLNPWVKGSYAAVLPGQYTTVWGSAGEPELNGQLLFAGEHTSKHSQGFMNGAYGTGIRAAKTIISQLSGAAHSSSPELLEL